MPSGISVRGQMGVAIVSGGLDSITMVYDLLSRGAKVRALSFNYGQRHSKELDAANAVLTDLGVWHEVISLTDFGYAISRSDSSLVNSHVEVPEGSYDEESMKTTVVPNRNMVMLSIACGVAIADKAQFVATAVHAGDHTIYPDCRPDFIGRFESAVRVGNEGFIHPDFEIRTPYLYKSKADIAKRAGQLKVPIERTWSCYKGGAYHCGRCGTCVERLEAIYIAGIPDETVYLDRNYWEGATGR